ncbi:SusC/RagA family TonB-linked outer membrane protein [Sphingobacterium paucimobilis]|nr:SusC/RagA family TonB-linked outer membrane protein [Sphingobacterium paucimobilis]
MKINLMAILMLYGLVHVSAGGKAQKISLKKDRISAEQFFSEIRKQIGYSTFYSGFMLDREYLDNINFKNTPLDDVLSQVTLSKGWHYEIDDKTIILHKLDRAVQQQYILQGIIKDRQGKRISGASIYVLGSNKAVVSNELGRFGISVSGEERLRVVFIGYRDEYITVHGKKDIEIVLQESPAEIEEVQIVSTGYQSFDRRKFTGAATTLKASEAERSGIPDVSRMLEGQVAGVSVQNVSATFGAAPKIRVRGSTSITGDNKPLWVVDGVVLEDVVNVSNDQLATGDVSTLQGSSVAGLNPDDIETFQVLKDAAATAMYGARAMNGVILITTKKGKRGPTVVNYTGNFTTYLKPTYAEYDIMNSYDQISVLAELERKGLIDFAMFKNMPSSGPYGKLAEGLVTWKDGRPLIDNTVEGRGKFLNKFIYANTDWFDLLFKNSLMTDHSLNMSGGGENSTFYFSTSYLRDNGWSIADNANRYTFNARGSTQINDKLQIGLIGNASIRDQRAPGTLNQVSDDVYGAVSRDFDINPFSYAMNTSRIVRAYDEHQNLEFNTMNYAPFNIIHELENNYVDLKMVDVKVQGDLQYKLPCNVVYDFIGSYRYMNSLNQHRIYDDSNFAEAYRAGTAYGVRGENSTIAGANRFLYRDPSNPTALPVSVMPYGGMYIKNTNTLKSFYFRNSLNWEYDFGKNYLRFFAAQELRYLDRITDDFRGYGIQYDRGGTPFIDPNSIKREVEGSQNYFGINPFYDRFIAVMSSANYSYDSKYQIALTGRMDGSNQLGSSKNARWLPTWNISGSWNIDQEKFMDDQSFFNTLTLRGTYGLTASMGAAKNSNLWLNSTSTKRFDRNTIEPSLTIQYLANNDLTWEKQYEANLGLESTFLSRRFNLVVDMYDRKGFDLIGGFYTSAIDGEYYKVANHANMKSQGIEVLFKAQAIRGNNFNWTIQLTNAFNKTRITRMINKPNIWSLVETIGGAKENYPQRGLFSIDFAKLDEMKGIPNYINDRGEVSSDIYLQSIVTDFLKYEGPVDPTYTGGLFNTFKYKDFSLGVLLTYSAGNKVRMTPRYKINYSDLNAYSYDFIERFMLPFETLAPSIPDMRSVNTTPAVTYNVYNYSTRRVADGSFVRMKQITLGYTLPKRIVQRAKLKNVSLHAVANNPFLIYTDKALNGQDPEFYGSGGVALPIPKQYTLSIKATL